MKIEIRDADGGYIVVAADDEISTEHVVTNFKDLLHLIQDLMGQSGGRYDSDRIYIVKAPGDKNEAFTDEHAKILFWDDDV